MIVPLAWALMGFGTGCLLTACDVADEQATAVCTRQAHLRVAQLQHEADVQVCSIYDRWSGHMDPGVRATFERRLGF